MESVQPSPEAAPTPCNLTVAQGSLAAATPVRRKRGKCMSRRIGQDGSVFQRGFAKEWNPTATAFGRYWTDVPGCDERKRRVVSLGVCPSRSVAKRKLREHIEREGVKQQGVLQHKHGSSYYLQRPSSKVDGVPIHTEAQAGETRYPSGLAGRVGQLAVTASWRQAACGYFQCGAARYGEIG